MKTILIVGGSKGIGNAILKNLADSHHIINIRTLIDNFCKVYFVR